LFTAQHFGDGQHQVGGGDAAAQLALEFHAHDVGGQEIDGLAQHAGFGLDAAHPPAHHTDAVDHGGVAVGADQGVWIVDIVFLVHAARQVFKVDLVHDAEDRKSTRLNSSHVKISYAVFCLKKKKKVNKTIGTCD